MITNKNNENIIEDLTFLDFLTVFSVILQVSQYIENLKQSSNDAILQELHKEQDSIIEVLLNNQKELLDNQKKILYLLETKSFKNM